MSALILILPVALISKPPIFKAPVMVSPALLRGVYPKAACLPLKVIQSDEVRIPLAELVAEESAACLLLKVVQSADET